MVFSDSDNILFENSNIELSNSQKSSDSLETTSTSNSSSSKSNNKKTKNKSKKESWIKKIGENRPFIIVTGVFIMFILIIVYFYMKGRLLFV